jgi:hypothetical protein
VEGSRLCRGDRRQCENEFSGPNDLHLYTGVPTLSTELATAAASTTKVVESYAQPPVYCTPPYIHSRGIRQLIKPLIPNLRHAATAELAGPIHRRSRRRHSEIPSVAATEHTAA